MGIDRVGSPKALSPDPGRRPQLDRRQLVKGVVAVSMAGAASEVGARMTARAANESGSPGTLPRTAASEVSTVEPTAGSSLEASLHVMMQ